MELSRIIQLSLHLNLVSLGPSGPKPSDMNSVCKYKLNNEIIFLMVMTEEHKHKVDTNGSRILYRKQEDQNYASTYSENPLLLCLL